MTLRVDDRPDRILAALINCSAPTADKDSMNIRFQPSTHSKIWCGSNCDTTKTVESHVRTVTDWRGLGGATQVPLASEPGETKQSLTEEKPSN